MSIRTVLVFIFTLFVLFTIPGCGKVPLKQFYELNYLPGAIANRHFDKPYPFVLRLKEFDIEEAYNRPQIVYRQSPFELRYYVYRNWAVKPSRMITDLVYKHLLSANMISSVIRRYDEGVKPDYELSGMIEALEEYDSDELWFAHIALRINLIHTSEGRIVYNKRFDLRKKVLEHDPELVIREMSALVEYAVTQAVQDLDTKLAEEAGVGKVEKYDTTNQLIPDSLISEGLK
jgi:ABC-type uncharacterized transport system auxiliary subunit